MTPIDHNTVFRGNADGQVCVMLPVELVWSEDYKFLGKQIPNETERWREGNAKWGNKSIMRLRPHIDLFDFLSTGNASPKPYADWYRDDVFLSRGIEPPFDEAQLLEYRFNTTKVFSEAVERDGLESDLLRVNAKFDMTRNVFVVDDGHHRCIYLLSRGFRRIPALISFEDLAAWNNADATARVNEEITAQGRGPIYTPVLLPTVQPMPVVRDWTYRTRLDHLLYFLGERLLPGSLLDIGSNTGFFSFHFLREGMEVVGCEPHRDHIELARRIGDAYRLPHSFTPKPVQELLKGDVAFNGCLFLTVLYHLMAGPDYREVLKLLDARVSDYLIWESGEDPNFEKIWIQTRTKFVNYQKIATTYATGKTREMGIFWRDGWSLDEMPLVRS